MLDNGVEMSFIFPPNPGPLCFGLGSQSFGFRGSACSWRKKVSLYLCILDKGWREHRHIEYHYICRLRAANFGTPSMK